MVHEAASRGYERGARSYVRARPGYPPKAVQTLVRALRLDTGNHVVELGAGTGIFTRQLVEHDLRVTAVEPVEAMRTQLVATVDAAVSSGTAEHTGLPDGVADAVVAATAWHWFDAPQALDEVARLLHPDSDGGLGLLWNLLDETVPWVAELAAITNRRRPVGQPTARGEPWLRHFDSLSGWTRLEAAHVPNPWPTTPDGVVERVLSSSVVAGSPEPERDRARREAWDVLARHGLASNSTMVLPYRTSVYWTRPA